MALLNTYVGGRYSVKLIRKQSCPRIATWMIFQIGVIMSLAAYFSSHDHSLVKAVLNVTDGVVVTVILAALLCQQRTGTIRFTRTEQVCLVISCMTLLAWAITKTAWVGLLGFQAVMLVAYFPTVESLWKWKPGRPPEPLETWSVDAVATLIGVVVDVTGKHDYLAMLYPLRAFLSCTLIVALIWRWRRKSAAGDALVS